MSPSLAAGLADIGIGRGDVVVVHLPNVPEFPIAWLAINALGAVMQTVHTPYGLRELEHLIAHGGGQSGHRVGQGEGSFAGWRDCIPAQQHCHAAMRRLGRR